MSTLWTPDQMNQPDQSSGSGIELPKGFSRNRDRETEKTAEAQPTQQPDAGTAPTPEQSQNPETASGTGVDGSPQQNPFEHLLFPPRGAQISCPSCNNPFVVPIFSIIDFGVNPELKNALLNNQVNAAACPQCGAGGMIPSPLMVHKPEHDFLGVFMPVTDQMSDMQRQQVIGSMTQQLMGKLPTEARKGYMLQPTQYFDWQRFMEKIWEFEGVTPEMLHRQQDQTALLQQLLVVANDEQALKLSVERNVGLIDREFFQIIEQVAMYASQTPNVDEKALQQQQAALARIHSTLLSSTTIGEEIHAQQEKIRAQLAKLTPETTQQELLEMLIEAWQEKDGEAMVGPIAMTAAPLLDYQFLLALAEKVEQAPNRRERTKLEQLREFIIQIQEHQRANQQAAMEQVQSVLREVLESNDTLEALRERADYIDQQFLSLLRNNVQSAQQQGATAAFKRLQRVYEQALSVIEERMPPEQRLLIKLINSPDEAAARKILRENKQLLSKEIITVMESVEQDMRSNNNIEKADLFKSLRSQITLML